MRLLADENIPLETVRALRDAGHEVFSAAESDAGASDHHLVTRASNEDRLIVTFDQDFGELVARAQQGPKAGVLLLRIVSRDAAEVTELLVGVLARRDIRWAGTLSVLNRTHLRQRPY